jgi:glycosyltransferase involved in cell wall biosynthesis
MISIVIPVFRGRDTLAALVNQLKRALACEQFEVVFVFDGGEKDSWVSVKRLQQEHTFIKAIKLSRNFGQHNATICGFEHCSGEVVVTMDEDLQHSPNDILPLIQYLKENDLDVVYGKYMTLNHNLFRNLTSTIVKKTLKIGMPDLYPDYTSFRVIRSEIAKELPKMNNSYTFLDGYISWLTTNIGSVSVAHHTDEAGESGYTFYKLFSHMLNIFFTFSALPIRIVSVAALAFFIVTLVFTLYVVLRAIFEPDYFLLGYPSLISIIGFGFSLTLYGMGILGEYIQRVNAKTTKRPNYLVSEVVSASDNHAK